MKLDYQDKIIRRLLKNIKEHIRYIFKNDLKNKSVDLIKMSLYSRN